MIESVKSEISKIDFESVYDEAYLFSKKMKKQFSNLHLPEDIIVEDQLPASREKFRVDTYRVIIDQILSSLNQRVSNNSNLIADIQYLIPKNFNLIENMPNDALTHIADLINIKKEDLKMELQNFSIIYPNLTTSVLERTKYIYKNSTTNINNSEKSSDESSAEVSDGENMISDVFCNTNKCKLSEFDEIHSKQSCLICVYKILYSLNMHVSAYSNLCTAYEYFLTLSVTEVNCERTFSKLKIIKSRLRSSLSQENLEALIIMSVERQLLEDIEISEVIEYLKNSSSLMYKMVS
ncbi:unnamed protein product [Macrosiphum euphorbiae]|uniref:HAT C-terminal dimerisation domain-containing protein n=1 Tax=Macrosiphum euphorbiae TaxID=13131 RepID=A0AAV0XTX6_9HEMI|nr:unnamed protein product [Macrosiphum euphorbiae]